LKVAAFSSKLGEQDSPINSPKPELVSKVGKGAIDFAIRKSEWNG